MQAWLINGSAQDVIRADDRGLAYGDGLFETIALRQSAPRYLERHIARLTDGCRRLAIPTPAADVIAGDIERLTSGYKTGTIKVIVTRGIGRRGYAWEAGTTPTRVVGFEPAEEDVCSRRPTEAAITFCRTPASCNPALAGMKTLNRLDNVLARAELRGGGVQEGLMLDPHDRVIGGTMSNLFMVLDGRLLTPALIRGGVRGVMRDLVMETARAAGIECSETDIRREALAAADELFLTNALIGLWTVSRCDNRHFERGPVTGILRAAMEQRGVEECAA